MANKIKVLPESVASKIAAGEVIERPASVVKELVENSIDAGSSEIDVIVEKGGKALIEVRDNGEGMEREDALLALERHATSKIMKEEDLLSINSLGFRGEALPSISSVSRMEVITRVHGDIGGTYISVEGGKIKEVREEGCPPGTMVRVKDLFFNIPARKKFMRSQSMEASYIHDIMVRIAMARPEVGFRYVHERRTIIDTSPQDDFKNRITSLLGLDTASQIFPVKEESKGLKLEGFLSHPNLIRSTASSIYLFVNRRPVHDRALVSAIIQGYHPLIPRGRYPVAVLYLTVSPDEVDINVHPSKREIRFRNPGDIFALVIRTVMRFVREESWNKRGSFKRERAEHYIEERPDIYSHDEWKNVESPSYLSRSFTFKRSSFREEQLPFGGQRGFFSSLRYMGQIDGTYLVLASSTGIVIIDQHAAHERILFERMKKDRPFHERVTQRMLVPISVELSQMESSVLERYADYLKEAGVEVIPFGERTWKIEALPPWNFRCDGTKILQEIVAKLMETGDKILSDEARERVLAVLACHGAIQARRPIEREEAMELLEEMDRTPSAGLCPHGRPTFVEISLKELEKRFGRH